MLSASVSTAIRGCGEISSARSPISEDWLSSPWESACASIIESNGVSPDAAEKKLRVRLGRLDVVEKDLDRLDRGQLGQLLSQAVHGFQFLRMVEQFLPTGARLQNVDGRVDSLLRHGSVQV